MNIIVREAEILDGAALSVTIAPHPFAARKRVETVRAGDTVAEIVAAHWTHALPCAVTADGVRVEKARWDFVVPRQCVELVGVPREPISAAIAALASAASAAVSSIGAAFAAGGLFSGLSGQLIGLGLAIGAKYLVNALFPPAQPQLSRNDSNISPTYSIGGARNDARPFQPVPVVLGTHRHSPPYAARPFTENIGDDQYVRLLVCWGHGKLDISDIRIGETPIGEFDDVEIETFQGASGDTAPTLYPKQVFQEDLNILLEPDTNNVRTTAADIDEIIVDLTAPQGLYALRKSDGKKIRLEVVVRLDYRPAGAGSYTEWRTVTLKGNDESAIRRSYRVKVANGQYDVRVRRTTNEYDGDDTYAQNVLWTAVRGVRNESPVDSDIPLALTALRIRATAQLSGQIETLNGICTSRVKSWNGASWADDTASNNPADLFRHVLQGPGNLRPVADADIDLDQLADWHDFCDTEGFTFNYICDARASVWDTLRMIAAAGRAVPTFVDGKWSVVWDEPDAPVVQHFTPANSSGFSAQREFIDMPHGWRVRFVNEQQGYLEDERIVYDDGYSEANATRFEGLEFPGVTDPDLVWRFARYHIAQLRLRRETYELTTDFEHLVCTRGDRVRVAHDVPKWGLGQGRVKAVDGAQVTLDGDVVMEAGTSYVIRFRKADGSSVLRAVQTDDSGRVSTLTLTGSGTAPEAGDLYMFGETDSESVVLRVQKITPGQDFSARLLLVDDAPAIFEADRGTIPAFQTNISEPVDPYSQPPRDLRANEFAYLSDKALYSGLEVSWLPPALAMPGSYLLQWKEASDDDWRPAVTVAGTRYTIRDLLAGDYALRVKAIHETQASKWLTAAQNVLGQNAIPPDVSTFRSAVAGGNIVLTWSAPASGLIKDYEIRHAPATSGATWHSSTPLVQGVEGTSYTAPYAKGSYFIKARSFADVYSVNATGLVVQTEPLSALNAVEVASDDPDFGGTHDNTVYSEASSGVILAEDADFFDAEITDFFDQENIFPTGRFASGTYTLADTVDLGAVYTSRLSASLSIGAYSAAGDFFDGVDFFAANDIFLSVAGQWKATAQIRTTDDDPSGSPAWSDWEDFQISEYTARAFEFRILFESFDTISSPLLTAARFTVDMPDRIVTGADIDSTASGVAISFSPPFKALKAFHVNGQDLATGDYYDESSKSESGATVLFRDAAGDPVARTFDYIAIGYGSVNT